MNTTFRQNSTNIINDYHKYKAYYDQKSRAQLLKIKDFVFLLVPKYDSQSHHERQVRRYELKRDRPFYRSRQRLDLTPDFEISITR